MDDSADVEVKLREHPHHFCRVGYEPAVEPDGCAVVDAFEDELKMSSLVSSGDGKSCAIPIRLLPGIGFTGKMAVLFEMIFAVESIGCVRDQHIVHAGIRVRINFISDQSGQHGGWYGYREPVIGGMIAHGGKAVACCSDHGR